MQGAGFKVQGAGFSEVDLALALFQLLEDFDELFVREHRWSPHPGLPVWAPPSTSEGYQKLTHLTLSWC